MAGAAALVAVAGPALAQSQQQQFEHARRLNEEARLREEKAAAAEAARRAQQRAHEFEQESGRHMDASFARQREALRQSETQGAQLEATRQAWLKKPALADARNPLLGRWTRPPSARGNASDPFAMVAALAQGGLCELLFSGGTFEFRPKALVGFDERTPARELDEVEYRGDGSNVVVIPKTTLKFMVFEFDGPDRINWQGQNCVLVRVGTTAGAAGAATAPGTAVGGGAAAAATAGNTAAGSVLSVSVSFGTGGATTPHAGVAIYVLRHDAEQTLRRGGFKPRPGLSILKSWSLECQQRSPACMQGAHLLHADAQAIVRADAQGQAQTPPIAPGAYYLFASKRQGQDESFWNVRVDVKPGVNTVRLDPRNAIVPR